MTIRWSSELNTGNRKIDGQHRQLLQLLNDVVDACNIDRDLEILNVSLAFLVDYTLEHFRDEEELQREYGFPGYERHKLEHDGFTKEVAALVERFQKSGSSSELSAEVSRTVATWFLKHIRTEDKKIGDHIRELKKAEAIQQ